MARRRNNSAGATMVGFVIAAAVVIAILKWLLITVAILIVPFGAWWLWDRAQLRQALGRATGAPTDVSAPALSPSVRPREPENAAGAHDPFG